MLAEASSSRDRNLSLLKNHYDNVLHLRSCGDLEMNDEQKQWFEIVRHNLKKPDPETTQVVKKICGLGVSESGADLLDSQLAPSDREAGFLHFHRPVPKPAGIKKSKKRPRHRTNYRKG
jgi:hypothetical protein